MNDATRKGFVDGVGDLLTGLTATSKKYTVKEFRDTLATYPDDAKVGVFGFDGGGELVDLAFNSDFNRLAIIGDEQ